MKKKILFNKIIISLLIILPILSATGCYLILKYEIYKDSCEKYTILGNVSQIISMILSFVNLCLILIFFIKDNNSAINEKKVSTKIHWFTNIIYEKNMYRIDDLFKSATKVVEEIRDLSEDTKVNDYHREIKKQYRELSNSISVFNENFTSLIEIIDIDLVIKLDDIIMKFQDDLTRKLEEVSNPKLYKESIAIIKDNKIIFTKELYEFNINLYED